MSLNGIGEPLSELLHRFETGPIIPADQDSFAIEKSLLLWSTLELASRHFDAI